MTICQWALICSLYWELGLGRGGTKFSVTYSVSQWNTDEALSPWALGTRQVIISLLKARQQAEPFSPCPAFVTGRSGRQTGLWFVHSDLLRLLRAVSRLGGHRRVFGRGGKNHLESQICVFNYFEKNKWSFHDLISWEYLKSPQKEFKSSLHKRTRGLRYILLAVVYALLCCWFFF